MGRGTSGALATPAHDGAGSAADSDPRLVARVRRGDDRAFELLYHRYHRRIHAYVLGMVKDHGRAEDVTQEVFVSALRRMRETEQPLAFKPWLYQIARNGCIDAFRRSRRAEEVSYDSDAGLAPADHSRLVSSGPSPDAAVAAKQDLDSLRGAFGGLSETHHEILVLRELEGLSYAEIGRRMGMSRPAVESTLFRARRRLTEEFDDIVSGARCLRIQGIIALAVDTRLGARDTRRLARHLAHCQPCRREALAAGLDRELFARPPLRSRIAARVAGWLPFPALLRLRRDDAPPPGGGRGASLAAQLPVLSDQLSSGWSKAAAGAALVLAGVGTGVGVERVASPPPAPPAAAAQAARPEAAPAHAAATTTRRVSAGDSTTSRRSVLKRSRAITAAAKRHDTPSTGGGAPSTAGRRTSSGGAAAQRPAATASPGGAGNDGTAAAATPRRDRSGGGSPPNRDSDGTASVPAALPTPTAPAAVVQQTTDTVRDTTQQAGSAIRDTTQQAGSAVRDTTKQVTGVVDSVGKQVAGDGPVGDAVGDATTTVDEAASQAANTVDSVGDAVGGLTGNGG